MRAGHRICLRGQDGLADRADGAFLEPRHLRLRDADLPGDCLPLTGPNAKYTVAADLQGEDGAVYHAQYVFIFRKEAS